MSPNERGHYFIEPLGIELEKLEGSYQNQSLSWLRWWDSEGNLLLTGTERAEVEKARGDRFANQAEQERQRAEQERQARRNAIPQLLATGMSVEQVAQILSLTVEEVRKISNRHLLQKREQGTGNRQPTPRPSPSQEGNN